MVSETGKDNEGPESGEEVTEPAAEPGSESVAGAGPEEKPVARSRSGGGFVSGLLAAAFLVLAIAVAGWVWRDDLVALMGTDGEDIRIAELEAKLAALEARSRDQETRNNTLAANLDESRKALATLTGAVADLGNGNAPVDPKIVAELQSARNLMADLEARLAALDAAGEGEAAPAPRDETAVRELQDTIAALSDKVSTMTSSLASTAGRVDSLERFAPPKDLAERLEALSSQSDVEGLKSRLAAIEEADPEGAARAAVVALSATELARAAATSRPFMTELDAFAALASNSGHALALRPYAETGVPTEVTLLAEFETTIHKIQEAERLREGSSIWSWIVNKVTGLFSIRKVGERDGDDWQSIVARAEIRVAKGDLDAAAREVAMLQGPAAEAAAPWAARVAARREVDALITGLTTETFAGLLDRLGSE